MFRRLALLVTLSTAQVVKINCQQTELELLVLSDGSRTVAPDALVKAPLASAKVAYATFGDKSSGTANTCFHLDSPLTDVAFAATPALANLTAEPHGHLEGLAAALADDRVGWSLRPAQDTHKLVKAVLLLTDTAPLAAANVQPAGREPFNFNTLRLDADRHCNSHNYPEYADVAQILKRGKTQLLVAVQTNDEVTQGAWDWAVNQALGSHAHLANQDTIADAVATLTGCTSSVASRINGVSPLLERQCESDCNCAENPECSCCSGFKVLLSLPTEPKDIEVKVTH